MAAALPADKTGRLNVTTSFPHRVENDGRVPDGG